MARPDDTVTLQVGGLTFTGWTDVRIVRGIELMPSFFTLRVTERLPGKPSPFPIDPGTRCKVSIGEDTVLTGFVDSYESRVSPKGHEITVVGRSSTADLVDAAAGVTSGQENRARMTFSAPTLLQLAQDLCKPFGITVTAPDGEGKPLVSVADGIPQFTMPLGATVFDEIEPRARIRQLLMIDGVDGNLILGKVGSKKAASGFTLPGSVLEAQVRFSKQDRFTVYLPSTSTFEKVAEASVETGQPSGNYLAPVHDNAAFKGQPRWDGQPRYRPHFVVNHEYFGNIYLAEQLAKWELARRYGRSQAVTALVALWRDAAGALWQPNTLAPVDMPALKLPGLTWVVAQVAFLKGFGTGTRTLVTLMPKEAFMPEPGIDQSFDPQVAQAQREALQQRDGRRDQG